MTRGPCGYTKTPDEPAAFRWIQKTAMDMRVPMRKVAELVIDESVGGDALPS